MLRSAVQRYAAGRVRRVICLNAPVLSLRGSIVQLHLSMTQKIAKARLRAYNRQGGLCHYCGKPMVLAGVGTGICGKAVPRDFLRRMACTAEHLIAKKDGGTNALTNI